MSHKHISSYSKAQAKTASAPTAICPAPCWSDVASTAWYRDAVAWGAANWIVGGFGDGSFGPDAVITREQLAVILYRYGKIKNYDFSPSSSLESFKDGNLTSSYAVSAMQWASGAGLISGKGSGILDQKGKATRAEVAAILMRFIERSERPKLN